MIHLGMHTDNWRTLSGSFDDAVKAAQGLGLKYLEFGVVDGRDFIQGLGYAPTVSLESNPIRLKRDLDAAGLQVSQIDAGYPLFGPEGAFHGVRYIQRAIQFAAAIECPCVDTTDGQFRVPGLSVQEVIDITCRSYEKILEWAQDYNVTVTIEPHGPYTTCPVTLDKIFDRFDAAHLGLNLDTGNTYIAGQHPPTFLKRFLSRLKHVHVKDVPLALAEKAGESTGIAMSDASIGAGANAENIRQCISLLKDANWDGVLSIECLGTDQTLKASVDWLRSQITLEATGLATRDGQPHAALADRSR